MEPLFVPLMVSRRRRAWRIAAYLLAGNVFAAILMYALGRWLAEPLIEPFIQFLGAEKDYAAVSSDLKKNGFVALFLVGVTPFPFQLGTAAAGAIGYSFLFFLAAVTLSRGLRYFTLAGLVLMIGARAEEYLARHQTAIILAGVAIFIGVSFWIIFG